MADRERHPHIKVRQAGEFHAPLRPGDSSTATIGCRHTNPDICGKNSMPNICAFVRSDGRCHSPPASWPKQYETLRRQREPDANG